MFFYLFPVVFGAAVGISYFGHCTFMVYLKYQALVDTYYHRVVMKPVMEPVAESKISEPIVADAQAQNESQSEPIVDSKVENK